MVTGASSGIGRAFAESIAARGYEVVAVARRGSRLRELEDRLARRGLRRSRSVVADLTTPEGLSACRRAAPEGVDVAVLNAGFGSLGPMSAAGRERQVDMVRLNCAAVVDLACHLLPGMVQRGRGAVIVVSSAAAHQPLPHMATYAATKAFSLSLVRALAAELHGTGVRTVAVCPGPVRTEFGRAAGAGPTPLPVPYATTADVVDATWRALRRGRTSVNVGPVAQLAAVAAAVVPPVLSAPVLGALQRARGR
jgi:short-subunit dehydrogenase